MKRITLKSTPLVWCMALVLILASCKMEEASNEKYPELPEAVAQKLIRPKVAQELSEGYLRAITKLQSLDSLVKDRAQVGKKEQEALKSEALKAIYRQTDLSHPPFELSVSSYYTLEELESYIAYAKREAAKQKIDLDGFRIYMGLFPDDPKFNDKRNFLTVFISPTGRPATQKGAFFSTTQEPGSDITGIGSLEYGGMGEPPSSSYPQ